MKSYKIIILASVFSVSCMAAGDSLYKANCATCHGIKGEKSAIGKSQPIHGMASEKIIQSLQEYGSGSKKSALPVAKAIKHKFTTTHTEKEVQEVADYISTL